MKLQTSVSGGDKLGTRLRQIMERMQKNSGVLIGLPAGTGSYEDGAPIAVIAAVHEFGSADGKIHERSFLRVPLRQNTDLFKSMFRAQMAMVAKGETTMHAAMTTIGDKGRSVSVEAINAGLQPGLAESTKKRRKHGGETPLYDSGRLAQSITFIVED